ncbi:hypothetical protein F4801DRAFT_571155, partial [Xylaria longipes]
MGLAVWLAACLQITRPTTGTTPFLGLLHYSRPIHLPPSPGLGISRRFLGHRSLLFTSDAMRWWSRGLIGTTYLPGLIYGVCVFVGHKPTCRVVVGLFVRRGGRGAAYSVAPSIPHLQNAVACCLVPSPFTLRTYIVWIPMQSCCCDICCSHGRKTWISRQQSRHFKDGETGKTRYGHPGPLHPSLSECLDS